MSTKPTYEELEQRVKDLERQNQKNNVNSEELQKLRHAIEGVPIAIGMSDPEGRHYFQNKAFTELFEYHSAAELESVGGGKALCLNRNLAKEKFDQIMSGNCWIGEHEMLTKNGHRLLVHERADAIKDLKGNIIGLIGAIVDVTDIKIAEENLDAAEKNLKNTFDISPSIICKANAFTGYFIEANPSVTKILGFSVEEYTSKPIMEFIHQEDKQKTIDVISGQIKGKGVNYFENRYLCKNGSYKWMSWNVTAADENGIVITIGTDITKSKQIETELAKYRDHLEELIEQRTVELTKSNTSLISEIKERKQAEERLAYLNKTLDQKVKKRTNELKVLNEHLIYIEEEERSNIAIDLHDTVVQTLGYSVSKIKNMEESDDANNAAMLSDVQEHIEQSLNEIRQLIFRLYPQVLKDFDIATAIAFLVEEINKKFHADMQYINTYGDSIDIDETKKITLYRAANELILNILKHSGVKKGKIELSKNQDTVLLKVEDSGIGFDMATINKNPFDGFGLFALSERCKNLGGNIKIKSILGEYTKTVIYFPLR